MLGQLQAYNQLVSTGWAKLDTSGLFRRTLLLPLIPLVLLLAVAFLVTPPPQQAFGPGAGTAAATEARAAALRVLDGPQAAPADAAAAAKALSDIAALRTSLAQASIGRSEALHRLYRAEALFLAAAVVAGAVAAAGVLAQRRLILGHALRLRPDLSASSRWMFSAVLWLAVAGVALALVPGALPLALPQDGDLLWMGSALALLLVLAALLAQLTAFGARLVAANYPDVEALREWADAVRHGLQAPPEDEAVQLQGVIARSPSVEPDVMLAAAVAVWPDTPPRGDPPAIDHGLTPKKLGVILNGLGLVLMVVLVSVLVVVALALDVVEAHAALAGRLAPGAAASADTWVLVLGAGFSLLLAAVLLPPAVRLAPFAAAEADIPATASPGGWTVQGTGRMGGPMVGRLEIAPRRGKPQADLPIGMRCYLGADRGKFLIVLTAAHYGGGFQTILSDTLKNRLAKVLGLLAPALTGSVLSVLG